MKITFLMPALATAMLLAGTAGLRATPVTPTPAPSLAPRPSNPLPFSGKIYTVDAVEKTFSMQNHEKKIRVYVISSETKLTKKSGPANFEDLKTGEEVRGMAIPKGNGQFEATSVIIGPHDTPKPLPSSTPPAPSAAPAPKPSQPKPAKKSPTPAARRPSD